MSFAILSSKTVPLNINYGFKNAIGFVNDETVKHCNNGHQDHHVEDPVEHTGLFCLKVAYSRYETYAIINLRSRIKMVDESVCIMLILCISCQIQIIILIINVIILKTVSH
jgi:hypothetical protein